MNKRLERAVKMEELQRAIRRIHRAVGFPVKVEVTCKYCGRSFVCTEEEAKKFFLAEQHGTTWVGICGHCATLGLIWQ